MPRSVLLLFARPPRREAIEKGFHLSAGEDLFAAFAAGWVAAARDLDAAVVVAAVPEDLPAWRRTLGPDVEWVPQRGRSFGDRLEGAVRAAGSSGDRIVVVGGDVVPSSRALDDALSALDRGADAVLAPAPDGGVSLLSVSSSDGDLLRSIRPRRRDVFRSLRARLASRGRSVAVIAPAADVDGRSSLRALRRSRVHGFAPYVARALEPVAVEPAREVLVPAVPQPAPAALRGPPPPA